MKIFLVLLLTFGCSAHIHAQPKQTIYYDDGRKYMEGRWTYTVNSPLATNLVSLLMIGTERWSRLDDEYGRDWPSSEYVLGQGHSLKTTPNALFLSMLCDGPVKVYYRNGETKAEVMFKEGAATGPFAVYYPSGAQMVRGMLTDGMPTGELTMFYANGQSFSKGNYTPYTQQELAEGWQKLYSASLKRYPSASVEEEDFLEGSVNDTAQATAMIRYVFSSFSRHTSAHAARNGKFLFYNKDGSKQAQLFYKRDKRSGDWTFWGTGKKPLYVLHHGEDGRILAATDSNGKRETLGALVGRWSAGTGVGIRRTGEGVEDGPAGLDPGVIVEAAPALSSPPGTSGAFTFVDQMPEFIGDVRAYLSNNILYPANARREGIEGRVVVRFVVRADGSITNAQLQRGIGGGCDEEALRVVRAMPKWKPGKQNGKPVDVWFNLPILFKLQ